MDWGEMGVKTNDIARKKKTKTERHNTTTERQMTKDPNNIKEVQKKTIKRQRLIDKGKDKDKKERQIN